MEVGAEKQQGFSILHLLEQDPSEELSRRSRKRVESALTPELREVPLLISPPCYLGVGDDPAVPVSVSQALYRGFQFCCGGNR